MIVLGISFIDQYIGKNGGANWFGFWLFGAAIGMQFIVMFIRWRRSRR